MRNPKKKGFEVITAVFDEMELDTGYERALTDI